MGKEIECNEVEMEEKMKVISMRDEELNEMRKQWDMKIEEQLETMKSLESKNSSLENEICEMRIVMDSTTAGLQQEKLNNDMKDSTIEELNEKVRRISEEKMRMKSENDKSIEDLELSKRKAEGELLSQQEVANEKIRKLEEAMSVQQELDSMLLKSIEVKLSAREEELNDIKVKCVENEEKLEEREKEITRLRRESDENEVEMEGKMKLISIREKESDEMIRQKEMKIEEQLEAMKSLTDKHACLENEISEMRIVMESTREGLQIGQTKNDMTDSTIEDLNEKACRISEHSDSIEKSNDILRSMEVKLGVTEKELNYIKIT